MNSTPYVYVCMCLYKENGSVINCQPVMQKCVQFTYLRIAPLLIIIVKVHYFCILSIAQLKKI